MRFVRVEELLPDFMKIRAIIVDDEPLARERICTLLRGASDVEVVAQCGDGRKAIAAIEKHRPDLLFLDVQMPEPDGFGVLASLSPEKLPVVVFVTAYDRYALKAFEASALDYLLKPFDRERFETAIARARTHVEQKQAGKLNAKLLALLEQKPGAKYAERLVVKTAGRITFLRTDEIDWVEAHGNYACLHVGKDTHLLRETMSAIEARLDPQKFIRIHRSTIANLERIKELHPSFHGDFIVVLRNGTQLTLSRTHRRELQRRLSQEI